MSAMRPVEALRLPGCAPNAPEPERPRFREIEPCKLRIDEAYQRDLSARSIGLIRRIVENWDWRRFKPPVVVEVDGEWHVIDGQHTAIAAATHGGLGEIPCMIAPRASAAQRAGAFAGHNRDRLNVTPTQIYFAELAAGDEEAQTVAQVCKRAGVKILKTRPARFSPGDTLAVSAIRRLAEARGAMQTRRVLDMLVTARHAPIRAEYVRAVAELLFAPEYRGTIPEARLVAALREVEVGAARGVSNRKWQAIVADLARKAMADAHRRYA